MSVTVARRQASLNEMQARLVAAVLCGHSNAAAMKVAGYSDTIVGTQQFSSFVVKRALQEGRQAQIAGEITTEALKAMRELLKEGTPAATRLGAAKWFLDQSIGAEQADKPLGAMTEAELLAVVANAQAVVAEGSKPRIIDVTPHNGAQPDDVPPNNGA